jgi:hypothetical protein
MALGHAHNRQQPPAAQGSVRPATTTNAVGLADHNGSAVGRIDAGHGHPNAIAAAGAGRAPDSNPGAGRTADAAAGGAGGAHGVPGPSSSAVAHGVRPTADNAGLRPIGINGTGVIRLGSGPAIIGGASNKSASINGTSVRAKH